MATQQTVLFAQWSAAFYRAMALLTDAAREPVSADLIPIQRAIETTIALYGQLEEIERRELDSVSRQSLELAATLRRLAGALDLRPSHPLFELWGDLAERQAGLELRITAAIYVPITSFEPLPYYPVRDIPVVIQAADGGFTASFFDANVSMSGDTEQEAFSNLKLFLIDLLEDLESEPPAKLGPEPRRQLALLQSLIHKRNGDAQ
jgi:predicted RNase H-like HicB family nuclease